MAEFSVYRNVVQQLLTGEERLPSLPAITLKIRRAMADPNCSHARLAELIMQDPALSALLMKSANCALYKTREPARSVDDALRLLGRDVADRLVMSHSVKSLFIMRSAALKNLFAASWRRQAVKTAICQLLTQRVQFSPGYQPVTGCFLSEVGSLALLAAFSAETFAPSPEDYEKLRREYARPLSVILLKKWQLSEDYVAMVRHLGDWQNASPGKISAIDLINLAHYHALAIFGEGGKLPPLPELALFRKLPANLQATDSFGLLTLIGEQEEAIAEYVHFAG